MNLQKFKNWLIINRDSKNTIETYLRQLGLFFKSFSEFNQETVNNYLLERLNQRTSKATWNIDVSALRAYGEFLNIEIKFPKNKTPNEKIPPHLKEDQLLEIFKKLHRIVRQDDKYKAIISVLFYCGARISELVNLRRDDFNFEEETVVFKNTKGKVDRIINFPKIAEKNIKNYFFRSREYENAFDVTEASVRKCLTKIGKEMGYKFNLHPHTFRHSCARYLLKELNNNLPKVMKLMGHKNVQTTMKYLTNTNEEAIKTLKEIYKKKNK